MRRRYTNALHETGVGVGVHVAQKKLPGHASLRRPGNRHVLVGVQPSPCASCPVWVRPCSLHSAVNRSAIAALPGSGCHRPGGSAPLLPRRIRAHRFPACVGVIARPARRPVTSSLPVPDLSCWSSPWYGCRQRPPGRFRRGALHDPRRHPLSIPFDRYCPYPLHPCQILDPEEGSVLSPVRDDRVGLAWPHVRQSLLQRRRISCIDVDAVGRVSGSHQQQSQRKRLPRKPRPHRATPCGSEPVPAGYPVGGSSIPRHIHTAYRPQRLHTASQIPDVM